MAGVRISKFKICVRWLRLMLLEKEKSEGIYDLKFIKTRSFFVVHFILWQE